MHKVGETNVVEVSVHEESPSKETETGERVVTVPHRLTPLLTHNACNGEISNITHNACNGEISNITHNAGNGEIINITHNACNRKQ